MTLRRKAGSQTGRRHPHYRAEKLASDDTFSAIQRPALVTIQHNIRRNKSRLGFVPDEATPDDAVSVGSKRKRALAGIENNAVAGPSNAQRNPKRLKRSSSPVPSDSDSDDDDNDDDQEAAMETEHGSDIDQEHSSDYLLNWAPRSQLEKLKKDHLIQLHKEARISRQGSDIEHLTRRHLAAAIFTARNRSKKSGVGKRAPDGHGRHHSRPMAVVQAPFTPDSDDYLSIAKGRNGLRRNQTMDTSGSPMKPLPLGRSFSLNTLAKNFKRQKRPEINSNGSTLSDEPPPITPISPPITRKRVQSDPKHALISYSESESEDMPRGYEPSPRRLRSRADRSQDGAITNAAARHLPDRTAKPKMGDLQEDDSESDSGGSDNDGVPASSAVDSDREEVSDEEDEDEETVEESPRKLRNGKVVPRDDPKSDEEDDADTEVGGSEISEEDADASADPEYMEEDEEIVVDGAVVDNVEESTNEDDEVDLSEETMKTLVRYRREELLRLCESRSLHVEGTKPQLAKALLEWRDSSHPSSSSASTVRAPSTEHPARKKARPPVLERSGRVHVSQPRTPPLTCDESIDDIDGVVRNNNPEEPEFEFDLETLGLEDSEIPYEKLVKREKIGSGGFKDVYSGTLGSRKVAIAEFRGTLTAMDIKELQLLRDLSHENIVRFFGVSVPDNTKETPVMMISELCTNGDLFDYIRNEKAPTLSRVLRLMFDIARGLEYLHKRKPSIIHRDCKSSNILITGKGRAKIADFGLAKVKQSTRSMVRSLVGTVNWQAPELWHAHPKYDHKADVFSCAMVFWEILQWHLNNKKYPWEGMNEHAIYEAVGTRKQRPGINGLRKQWCPEIVDLLERMWAQDPRDRPTMSEVVVELDNMRA